MRRRDGGTLAILGSMALGLPYAPINIAAKPIAGWLDEHVGRQGTWAAIGRLATVNIVVLILVRRAAKSHDAMQAG